MTNSGFSFLLLPSGKPLGDRPVRLLGQVLHATLREWEFSELHNENQIAGQPLYCRGVFDAITIGEVQFKYGKRKTSRNIIQVWTGTEQNKTGSLFCVDPAQNETVLVFRGSVFWTVSADGDVSSPLPLRQRWPELPPAVEAAAFSPLDSKWYFFKGTAPPCSLMWPRLRNTFCCVCLKTTLHWKF